MEYNTAIFAMLNIEYDTGAGILVKTCSSVLIENQRKKGRYMPKPHIKPEQFNDLINNPPAITI